MQCKASEYNLELLHVQDQGFVKFGDSSHMPELQLNLINFTVILFSFRFLPCCSWELVFVMSFIKY